MSSLESTVLLDKVKVITSDDDGSLHLHLSDDSSEDSATRQFVKKGSHLKCFSQPEYEITLNGSVL